MQGYLNLASDQRKVPSLQRKGLGWVGREHNPLLFVLFMVMKMYLIFNKFSLIPLKNR